MSYRAICITATELILLYHLYQCNRTKCQGKSVHEEAKCLLILNTSPITTSTQLHIPYSVMLYPNLTKVLLNCHSFIHSFIPLVCAECNDSFPFSGASSIPLCYVLFPATLLNQLFFHPLSPHLAIYFLVYLSALLLPNSYIYNTFLGILFSSILCTCRNQHNLFNLIVSVIVGFLTIA